MSEHIKVNEDFVKNLVSNAAWEVAHVSVTESASEEAEPQVVTEEHSCPLCDSTLAEELSDEVVLEHIDQISALLDSLSETVEEEVDEMKEDDEEPDVDEGKKKKKKDDGSSKGDKGKDEDDPEARDYTDGGDRKGDDSKTKPGKKDFMDKVKALKK